MWIELAEGVIPLEKEYQVKDEHGNVGFAQPTYYPFKVGENKTGRRWGSEVIPCEPYWDGGWLVRCVGKLTSDISGKITHFREF